MYAIYHFQAVHRLVTANYRALCPVLVTLYSCHTLRPADRNEESIFTTLLAMKINSWPWERFVKDKQTAQSKKQRLLKSSLVVVEFLHAYASCGDPFFFSKKQILELGGVTFRSLSVCAPQLLLHEGIRTPPTSHIAQDPNDCVAWQHQSLGQNFASLFEWQNSGRRRRCFLVKYLYLCFDKSKKIFAIRISSNVSWRYTPLRKVCMAIRLVEVMFRSLAKLEQVFVSLIVLNN